MDLRKLEHFLAVADSAHFTRAAAELRLSQSGLSASVRALERDFGSPLFERTTRTVLLTAAGRALLPHARRILREAADARAAVDALRGCDAGTLAVGVVQTLTAVDLPATLAQFHALHPEVEVTLREAPTVELLASVEDGTLDLAYVALDATPLPPGVLALRSFAETLVLVAGDGHPLAGRPTTTLDALREFPFVNFQAGLGLETVVAALFAEAGVERRLAFHTSEMDVALALVARGLGIAVVPEPVAARSALHRIAILPHAPRRRMALVGRTPEPSNPAAGAFLAIDAADARRDIPSFP